MKILNILVVLLTMIALFLSNFRSNDKWITTVEPFPDSCGPWAQILINNQKVTETVVFEAQGVEVNMYLEPGLGWLRTTLPGKHHVYVHLDQKIYIPAATRLKVFLGKHAQYEMRLCAVSAPYWVRRADANTAARQGLNSRTPFSLQNAMRCIAQEAQRGNLECNWADFNLLSDSVLLFDDFEDNVDAFKEKILATRPHILFIGSMTLSFPGALEVARTAKHLLGDDVLIVLGGKHVNETFYVNNNIPSHHKASPLLLMQNGQVEKVFDIVIAGDGEDISLKIAEAVSDLLKKDCSPRAIFEHMEKITSASGTWCLGWINSSNEIQTCIGSNSLDRDKLPPPAAVFGIDACFPIFETDFTAHVYSDSGRGCVRDCDFCSERRSIAGPVQKPGGAADRLFHQLCTVKEISEECGCSMSAFVEDSILLMGSPQQLSRLADLMEKSGFYMKFGGQFTIPDLINPQIQKQIIRLKQHGLCYIYAGMETINPAASITLSKNRSKEIPWIDQNEKAIGFISDAGLRFGVSILFGLGESRDERMLHLNTLATWKKKYLNPQVVSLNWATEHPLFNKSQHDFVEWGTDRDDPRLGLMQGIFGEASAKYCFHSLPELSELNQIKELFKTLNLRV